MLDANTIREILNRKMKKGRSYSLREIYAFIPSECLDEEDFLPSYDPPKGDDLKWMRQVRNVIQSARSKGRLSRPYRGIYIRLQILS